MGHRAGHAAHAPIRPLGRPRGMASDPSPPAAAAAAPYAAGARDLAEAALGALRPELERHGARLRALAEAQARLGGALTGDGGGLAGPEDGGGGTSAEAPGAGAGLGQGARVAAGALSVSFSLSRARLLACLLACLLAYLLADVRASLPTPLLADAVLTVTPAAVRKGSTPP